MARVSIYLDSINGEDLGQEPEHTHYLEVDGIGWELTLGKKGETEFQKLLASITKHEDEGTPVSQLNRPTATRGRPAAATKAKRDPEQTKAIRDWAKAQGLEHNGKPLSDRGRIPEHIEKAFEDAHK